MRKLLIWSFSYLTLITLILFLYNQIFLTIFLLFTTAFALGFIEPLREIYFFKNVKTIDEEKTYPIFHTSFSTGSIFGKFSLGLVLTFLAGNFIYLFISLSMLLTAFICFSLKDYNN